MRGRLVAVETFMRKILIGLAILVIGLFAVVLIVPALIPASVYKEKITIQIGTTLGREVQIDGDVKLSVFPTLQAKAGKVKITNAEGFTAENFATMESLQARIRLLPLFKKQVEITSFTLVDPVIAFEKKKDGRINWAFGAQAASTTPPKPAAGPFKRDGRFSDLSVSLGVFTLKNGHITYKDAANGQAYDVENVNVRLAMPGLDKPLSAKGDLVINGQALDVDMRLDTPQSFLSGQSAPVMFNLKSALGDIFAKGQFTPSEAISFDLDLEAKIPSTQALDKFLNLKNPYNALTENAALKGKIIYDGQTLEGRNANITLQSKILNTRYKGDFMVGAQNTANGRLEVRIDELPALQSTLKMNLPQLAAFQTAELQANLKTDGHTTTAEGLKLVMKGETLTASYDGQARYNGQVTLDGDFLADGSSLGGLLKDMGLQNLKAANLLGDLHVLGHIKGPQDRLTISGMNFKSSGPQLSLGYQGDIGLGSDINLEGRFEAMTGSVPTLLQAAELDAQQIPTVKMANILGRLEVSGQITGRPDAATITELKLNTEGDILTASYTGAMDMGQTPKLNGNFTISAPSLQVLAEKAGLALPLKQALGALKASGRVQGPPNALHFEDIKAALSDGLVNLDFAGEATTGKAMHYEGDVKLGITSLRKLAALNGNKLPPDTPRGVVFGPLDISGHAKGTAQNAHFTDAKLKLDDLAASGSLSANLTGKPVLTGNLEMTGLDLRPYQAASYANRPKGLAPWSETELKLDFLNTFDGDFTLNTPNIKTLSVEMGPAIIRSTLKNGVLETKIPDFSLYGGKGLLDFIVDVRHKTPKIALDFTLQKVDAKGFLGAAANMTRLTGNTGAKMSLRGQGHTQADIMRSLSGQGDFEISEGLIKGIDINTFVKNLNQIENILQNHALPPGLGGNYQTPFDKLAGLFTVENGIARIGNFTLDAKTVLAEGSGALDIGNQKIDFSLRPYMKNGKGLAGYGIPLRFRGGFGQISASLDTDMMKKIIAARAKAKLQDKLKDTIGGALGGQSGATGGSSGGSNRPGSILGDILGIPSSTQNTGSDTPGHTTKKAKENAANTAKNTTAKNTAPKNTTPKDTAKASDQKQADERQNPQQNDSPKPADEGKRPDVEKTVGGLLGDVLKKKLHNDKNPATESGADPKAEKTNQKPTNPDTP